MDRLRRRFPHTLELLFDPQGALAPADGTLATRLRRARRRGAAGRLRARRARDRGHRGRARAAARRAHGAPSGARRRVMGCAAAPRPSARLAAPDRTIHAHPPTRPRTPRLVRLHRLAMTAFRPSRAPRRSTRSAGAVPVPRAHRRGQDHAAGRVAFAFFGRVPGARARARALRSDHAGADGADRGRARGHAARRARPHPPHPRAGAPEGARRRVTTGAAPRVARRARGRTVLAQPRDAPRRGRARSSGCSASTTRSSARSSCCPRAGFARFLHAGSRSAARSCKELFDVGRFCRRRATGSRAASAEAEQRRGRGADAPSATRCPRSERVVPDGARPEGWRDHPDVPGRLAGRARRARRGGRDPAEEVCRVATAAREARRCGAERRARPGRPPHEAARPRAAVASARGHPAGARRRSPRAGRRAAGARRPAARGARRRARPSWRRYRPPRATRRALRAQADELRTRAGEAGALDRARGARCRRAGRDRASSRRRPRRTARATEEETCLAGGRGRPPRRAARRPSPRRRAQVDRLPGLVALAESARARVEAAKGRDGLDRLAEARTACTTAPAKRTSAAREALVDLTDRRLAGIAFHLARQLADGEPCAVCGSLEHPVPAPEPDGRRARRGRGCTWPRSGPTSSASPASGPRRSSRGSQAELAAARALAGRRRRRLCSSRPAARRPRVCATAQDGGCSRRSDGPPR